MPHLAHRPVADVLMAGPRAWIYRLRDPSPRLKFSTRVVVADAGATTGSGQLVESPSPDRVLIDPKTPPAKTYGARRGRARQRRASSTGISIASTIETESDRDGVLRCTIPIIRAGSPRSTADRRRILRADVLFRGIEVPAGRHRVVFRFAPFSRANLVAALKQAIGR